MHQQTALSDTCNAVIDWLAPRSRLLLLTHERPDGDAYGAIIGLLLALQQRGKECVAYVSEALPRRYRDILPQPRQLLVGEPVPVAAFDGVVCLDVTEWSRVAAPPGLDMPLPDTEVCVIDHHPDNTRFGDVCWVAPDMAAAAQMVAALLRAWGTDTCSRTAQSLLAGMIMDTGGFRFPNTTATVLRDAAFLTDAGADYAAVMQALFMEEGYGRRMLLAHLTNQARFEHDRRYAYAVLTDADLTRLDVSPQDTEGVIDALKVIEGVEIACLLQPQADDIRVSLRSKRDTCPVNGIAKHFGGGGHRLAAGARVAGRSLQALIAEMTELTKKVLDHDR